MDIRKTEFDKIARFSGKNLKESRKAKRILKILTYIHGINCKIKILISSQINYVSVKFCHCMEISRVSHLLIAQLQPGSTEQKWHTWYLYTTLEFVADFGAKIHCSKRIAWNTLFRENWCTNWPVKIKFLCRTAGWGRSMCWDRYWGIYGQKAVQYLLEKGNQIIIDKGIGWL